MTFDLTPNGNWRAERTGWVSAVSHSFWLSDCYQFFIEFCSKGEVEYILVNDPELQGWQQEVEVLARYRITGLQPHNLKLDNDSVQVLVTFPDAMLTRLGEEKHQVELFKRQPPSQLSCRGKITGVIDAEAGIYVLNNRMKLYITFLKDLTRELWTGEAGGAMAPPCTRPYQCLAEGDIVSVYRAHYIREKKDVTLVCCGQSQVVNWSRKFLQNSPPIERLSWVSGAVQSLSLGLRALTWLQTIRNDLRSTLMQDTKNATLYSLRIPGSDLCILTTLLREVGWRRPGRKRSPHSLLWEFLRPAHECPLLQEFSPPFELVSVMQVFLGHVDNTSASHQGKQASWGVQEGQRDSAGAGTSKKRQQEFWNYCISPKRQCPAVLVGRVESGPGGVLQLHHNEIIIDVVVMDVAEETSLSKLGSIVGLFNFCVVTEYFNTIGNVRKVYVTVKASDLFILREPQSAPTHLREVEANRRCTFHLKLLSKSSFIIDYHQNGSFSLPKLMCNRFFLGLALISQIGPQGEVVEKWQKLVKFSGKSAELYPVLEVGDKCEVRMLHAREFEVALKHPQPCHWLRGMSEFQRETNCIILPQSVTIVKLCPEKMKWGEVSVQQVMQPKGHCSELVTTIGVVMVKQFWAPKYPSEMCPLPLDICNSYHVGVPESKNLRLLIRDEGKSTSEVWLYLTCTYNNFTSSYPLLVIPGVRVIVTEAKRMVARTTGNVYLMASSYTRIIPVALPQPPVTVSLLNLGKELREPEYHIIKKVPSHIQSFVCFARVSKVRRAKLKAVCKFCNFEMRESSCTNCHAQCSARMEAALEVIIDDGTGTILLFISHVKHFITLQRLSRLESEKLADMVVSKSLQISYEAPELRGSQSRSHDRYGEAFKKMLLRREVDHSYKFTCTKQINQQHYSCLDVSCIRPHKDVSLLKGFM